jgi:hypothetical protein
MAKKKTDPPTQKPVPPCQTCEGTGYICHDCGNPRGVCKCEGSQDFVKCTNCDGRKTMS